MNKLFKKIGLTFLGLAVLIGGVSLIASAVNNNENELKTIHPTFSVGGLDENGEYEESDLSLYTKTAFECRGLEIELDFDNNIQYQIFYYESDGDFVRSTTVFEDNYTAGDLTFNITHARIELTPIWSDDVDVEDQILNWSNKGKFSKQLTIKVDKNQDYIDLFNENNVTSDKVMISGKEYDLKGYAYLELHIKTYMGANIDLSFEKTPSFKELLDEESNALTIPVYQALGKSDPTSESYFPLGLNESECKKNYILEIAEQEIYDYILIVNYKIGNEPKIVINL